MRYNKNMKIKAILFDFDGLMVDTESVWQEYFIKANKVFNLSFTEEDRIKCIGKNEQAIRAELKSLYPNIDVDVYRDWIRESVHNHINTVGADLKLGLKELLTFIKENNLLSAIVSGTEEEKVVKILNKKNVDTSVFNCVIGGNSGLPAKPNPDVYLKACEKLGVKPSEAMVLEDSYNGVIAGKRASCFTVMVPDTMPPNEDMKKTADLILNNLLEVVELLKNNQ